MTREYYRKHRKQILARMKEYNRRTRTKKWYRDYWKKYGRANYLRYKAAGKLWHQKFPEKAKRRDYAWAAAHPIKRRKICNAWYERNKKEQCARNRKRYWQNVETERKRGRDESREWRKKHPIKTRRKVRQQYKENPERYRLASSWSQFRKRWGIEKSKQGKEIFAWLRKLRKEHDTINRLRNEGAISEREQRQRLRQLVSKLQRKSSIKTPQA